MAFYNSHRALLNVTGSEAKSFLNRVVTCRTDNMADGDARYGALLTPQGKILTDLFLYDLGGKLFLDLPLSTKDDFKKRLNMLKLRADVQFEDVADLSIFVSDNLAVETDGALAEFADPRKEETLKRVLVPKELTMHSSNDAEWTKCRFENFAPECGLDYAPSSCFPADVNMDLGSAIDFKKGCFVGQEVASRMKRKTEVRKRTALFIANTSANPGDEVKSGGSTLGEILNWQSDRGLVLIRLDRLAASLSKGDAPQINDEPASYKLPDGVELPRND